MPTFCTLASGVKLHYRIQGQPGAPWLVLLNGLLSDTTMWAGVLPALSPRFHVLTFDCRGQGRSDAPEDGPYTVEGAQHGELTEFSASELRLATTHQVEGEEPIEAEPFPAGTKAAQKKVFEERLATLEDIFCERLDLAGNTEPYGVQLKLFRPHRDAWSAKWKADPKATWPLLLATIATANTVASEFTAWTPAA